jgi:hypothetical protein
MDLQQKWSAMTLQKNKFVSFEKPNYQKLEHQKRRKQFIP